MLRRLFATHQAVQLVVENHAAFVALSKTPVLELWRLWLICSTLVLLVLAHIDIHQLSRSVSCSLSRSPASLVDVTERE